MTFTCSILRLSGVLLILIITKLNVIMLIIGKILEENLIFLIIIHKSYVRIGKLVLLLVNMRKVVYFKLLVKNAMVGKNRNIIHTIIKQNHAKIRNVMGDINVLFIIAIRKGELWKKVKSQL